MTARTYLTLTALFLCVLGLPLVVPAEPISPQIPRLTLPAQLTHPIGAAAIERAMSRPSVELIALPYFPPDPDGDSVRPSEQTLLGGLDKDDEEEIPLMEETLVEDTFEDPFATESEPVRDPWEPFNTNIFTLNYNLDRYALKPIARVYSAVVAPDLQDSFANAFYNLGFASRFLNNVFQGKFDRAGTEMQRFLLNSILGVGGLFDVAKYMFDIEAPPVEDSRSDPGILWGYFRALYGPAAAASHDGSACGGVRRRYFHEPGQLFYPVCPEPGSECGGPCQ